MTFNIGPLTISVIQLFILALGVALALAAFNGVGKTSKVLGIFIAIIIIIITIIITFFKVSEL